MRITTTVETIEKLKTLLQTYDAGTEPFLNDLPTREKYAILALVWKHTQCYEDYEEALGEAMRRVSAQDLTKYLMEYPWLWCPLQDIAQIADRDGFEGFEVMCADHDEENG